MVFGAILMRSIGTEVKRLSRLHWNSFQKTKDVKKCGLAREGFRISSGTRCV